MSWRPIFVHEFLDRRVDNISGVQGEFVVSSPPPPVNRRLLLLPGVWFTYRLDRPRVDVIGLDITYRVHAPTNTGATLPLLTIPGAFAAVLRFSNPLVSEIVDGDLVAHAELRVDVGGAVTVFDGLRIPHRFVAELRIVWHTSGQLHVWMDRTLEGYQPAVQPGARLTIGELSCGQVNAVPARRPRWFVDRLTVRALDELDAVESVIAEFPLDSLKPDVDNRRCRLEAMRHAQSIVHKYRALMETFIAATTHPWQRSASPNSSAFDPSSVRAHAAAVEAFKALIEFFREGDPAARAAYLKHLHAFLSELHSQVPQAFQELLDDLEQLPPPPQACLDLAATALAGHEPTVQMLSELGDETLLAAQRIAGGDDDG